MTERRQSQQSREWYDTLAPFYDALVDPFQGRLRRQGIDSLDVSTGDYVLDVGCGTGRGVARLADAVGDDGIAVGVDVAPKMCRRTRDRSDSHSSAVVCGDALSLPFGTDSFDAVLVSFTLELFEDSRQTAMLEEIRRVLTAGGRLCVVAPTTAASAVVAPLYERLNDAFSRLVDSRPVDVGGVLADAGFDICQRRIDSAPVIPVELVVARLPDSTR